MLSNNKEEFYPEMDKTQLKIPLYICLGLCKDLFLGARRIPCDKYRVSSFYSNHLLYFSEASKGKKLTSLQL